MSADSNNFESYFPPKESEGGWRWLATPDEVRSVTRIDPAKLEMVHEQQAFNYSSDSWGVVIIRNGYLVKEFYTFNILKTTRYDIWSGTATFTGTAWGLLLEDSRQGRLPGGRDVTLDNPVYEFIPDGDPHSDPGKAEITIRHLLTMTSGIPGESTGLYGLPTVPEVGPFEHALGRASNRHGKRTDQLVAKPGTAWDYSDPALAHLSLAFAKITGREIKDTMHERVFVPIGIEHLTWDMQGGGAFLGPHTCAHTGIHISARELARFGYFMLRGGKWQGKQILPQWWVDLSTRSSQSLQPGFGYLWWVNTAENQFPGLPPDTFAISGYRTNRCYIIPSLDLVVARVASGPIAWNDQWLIGRIVAALL